MVISLSRVLRGAAFTLIICCRSFSGCGSSIFCKRGVVPNCVKTAAFISLYNVKLGMLNYLVKQISVTHNSANSQSVHSTGPNQALQRQRCAAHYLPLCSYVRGRLYPQRVKYLRLKSAAPY